MARSFRLISQAPATPAVAGAQSFLATGGTVSRTMADRAADIVRPEEFGLIGGVDDTTALLLARDAALARKAALVLGTGNYALKQTMDWQNNFNLVISPRAKLIAADNFVGTSMVRIGNSAPLAEDWSIRGQGHINGRNVVDNCIEVVSARFAKVHDLKLIGANVSGIVIGDNSKTTSYEVDMRNVWVFYNDVANSSVSRGIHHRNVSDSYLNQCHVIGYRQGFRSERGSIEYSQCHTWSRAVHGPFTHGYYIDGNTATLSQCYADTPTNYGDNTITDVYGFWLDGDGVLLSQCRVLMNTNANPDVSTDNVLTAFYCNPSRPRKDTIIGAYASGASGSKRYKAFLGGDYSAADYTGLKYNSLTNFADPLSIPITTKAEKRSVATLPSTAKEADLLLVADGADGAACMAVWAEGGWKRLTLGTAPAHDPTWTWDKSAASAGGFTFARASGGLLLDLDADGDYDSVASGVERLYTAGTLKNYTALAGLRKNWWINNSGTGGVAGTPGTVPTGLTLTSSGSGLTRTLAYGTDTDGLPYTDITYAGIATAAVTATYNITSSWPATVMGDVWTMSCLARVVSGSVTGLTTTMRFVQKDASNVTVGSTTTPATPFSLTSADQLCSYTFSMNQAATAKLDAGFRISIPINTDLTVPIVIRLKGLTLMQQGFASSGFILTTGSAVQVEAETLTKALVAADVAEGTVVVDWYNSAVTPFLCRTGHLWNYIDSGTTRLALRRNPGASGSDFDQVQLVMGNNVVLANFVPGIGVQKTVITWGAAGYALANNGVSKGSGATYTAPTGSTVETIGGEIDVTGGVNAAPNRLIKRVVRYTNKVTATVAATMSVLT